MVPVICLITAAEEESALIDRVYAAARVGVHLIQIRRPELESRALASLVERALRAVHGTAARLLVNDRVDVALATGAHGVHLRAASLSAPRVRAIAPPGFLIGRSVHSAEDAARARDTGALDYLIFGTVFETASKPGVVATGPAMLRAVCADVPLPVLAVGGVTVPRLAAVARAGAAGFAAIGLFATVPISTLRAVVGAASDAFDTPGTVS
jgi:thiamine-phosphate pyrophosphorylase